MSQGEGNGENFVLSTRGDISQSVYIQRQNCVDAEKQIKIESPLLVSFVFFLLETVTFDTNEHIHKQKQSFHRMSMYKRIFRHPEQVANNNDRNVKIERIFFLGYSD